MTIKKKCPTCGKIAATLSESFNSDTGLITTQYVCGHSRTRPEIKPHDIDVTSTDGKKPYKFQLDGACFGLKAQGRVLIADEMGLGKTIQAGLICKADPKEYLPILIVCKAGLKSQIQREMHRWFGFMCQTIQTENDFILKGFHGYIISYEALAYSEFKNKRGTITKRGMQDPEAWIKKLNPRTIVLDECQKIKNLEAKRTRAVQKVSQHADHLIALSGTPIENNFSEYFPILNMLYPEKFYNREALIQRWAETYWNGNTQKVGGIKDPKAWKNYTSDFIIRRTRKEVLPDLPEITRNFRFEELGEKVEEAYKEEFKKFQDFYLYGGGSAGGFAAEGSIIAYLSKMRHLTGIAKIPGVVEFTEEFLQDTDRKLVIFCHHKDVASELVSRLSQVTNVLHLDAPVNPDTVDKFWKPEYRVMVASTLAAGEGLNLQCCSDCIMMERQWNPPKEEQAEGRFIRIGQKEDKVTATYFTAVGTVDEFFADLVEQKRSIFASTMDGQQVKWNEATLIKELAEILASKGGKKWGW